MDQMGCRIIGGSFENRTKVGPFEKNRQPRNWLRSDGWETIPNVSDLLIIQRNNGVDIQQEATMVQQHHRYMYHVDGQKEHYKW